MNSAKREFLTMVFVLIAIMLGVMVLVGWGM